MKQFFQSWKTAKIYPPIFRESCFLRCNCHLEAEARNTSGIVDKVVKLSECVENTVSSSSYSLKVVGITVSVYVACVKPWGL